MWAILGHFTCCFSSLSSSPFLSVVKKTAVLPLCKNSIGYFMYPIITLTFILVAEFLQVRSLLVYYWNLLKLFFIVIHNKGTENFMKQIYNTILLVEYHCNHIKNFKKWILDTLMCCWKKVNWYNIFEGILAI